MEKVIINFKQRGDIYKGRHLEIRDQGTQIRFYEVDTRHWKEHCLKKDTVKYLIGTSIPRNKTVLQALSGDKSIFD